MEALVMFLVLGFLLYVIADTIGFFMGYRASCNFIFCHYFFDDGIGNFLKIRKH